MSKEIYVIAKFKLQENSEEKIVEWKKISDIITEDMNNNAEGLIFRDSVIDEEGNVQCILKWDSKESQEKFEKIMNERFKNEPELMERFGKIGDMSTMSKDFFDVV